MNGENIEQLNTPEESLNQLYTDTYLDEEESVEIEDEEIASKRLNHELTLQIKRLFLNGMMVKDIQKKLGIKPNTWDSWMWRNTQGFRDMYNRAKLEKMIDLTEKLSIEILEQSHIDTSGKVDNALLSTKQREAQFIRETVAKEIYSKKTINDNNISGKITYEWNDTDNTKDSDTIHTEVMGKEATQFNETMDTDSGS